MILFPIFVPIICALLILTIPRRHHGAVELVSVVASFTALITALALFGREVNLFLPWAGSGINFSLRAYHFSVLMAASISGSAFLLSLYYISFLKGKDYDKPFLVLFLATLGFSNGAVLSNNLALLLFFWEGLLCSIFGMIFLGGKDSFRTAIKAFIIIGVADLMMMLGIVLTGCLAGTLEISGIHLGPGGAASAAFILLMTGAVAKAGAIPFHTWIPDAALDAPLPFMALMPGALEKLTGIYFLTRISMDMFSLPETSWLSYLMMTIGAVTIVIAVMMALIQKDYKKLLSYHAISQVGYMVLGIGTATPAGIIGGLFHMINNALYKSCLFLTGGAVEKQAGTTDLSKLGGLAKAMPVTFGCFLVCALSISGVPPFNGFFSKELVYDAALERGVIFYIAALIGSFFTAASFLKLGHAAYLGRSSEGRGSIKEASWPMLVPMIVISSICLLFGVFNRFPVDRLISPVIQGFTEIHSFSGWPEKGALVWITVLVLALAFVVHWFNAKKRGSGLKASDYIHYAPVLHEAYDAAERKVFDPYVIGMRAVDAMSKALWAVDRSIDSIYGVLSVNCANFVSLQVRKAQNGSTAQYLVWALLSCAAMAVLLFVR